MQKPASQRDAYVGFLLPDEVRLPSHPNHYVDGQIAVTSADFTDGTGHFHNFIDRSLADQHDKQLVVSKKYRPYSTSAYAVVYLEDPAGYNRISRVADMHRLAGRTLELHFFQVDPDPAHRFTDHVWAVYMSIVPRITSQSSKLPKENSGSPAAMHGEGNTWQSFMPR